MIAINATSEETNRPAADAVIVDADVRDFTCGKRDRANRLVEAVRPITDTWYPRFMKAATKGGTDAVVRTWWLYKGEVLATAGHPKDEIFRYLALAMMINTVRKHDKIPFTTYAVLELIRGDANGTVEFYYPFQRFGDERDVYDFGKHIDTLDL